METTTKEEQVTSETLIDHGTTLVHSITGEPRNLLHEISIPRDHTMRREGYTYQSGWVDKDGRKWNLYTKQLPIK